MIFRLLSTFLAALTLATPLVTAHAGVVSKSKWDRDFQFGRSDALEIQVFRLEDNVPVIVVSDTFKLTGSGYTTIDGERVKLGGLNMFSALASLESAFRRDSFAIGLETKAQISKQNGREIVFVYGEVKRPGVVTIKDDASLADLIEAAGGVTKSADLERITISHNGTTLVVDSSKEGDTKVMAGASVKVSRGLLGTSGPMEKRFKELESAKPGRDRLMGE